MNNRTMSEEPLLSAVLPALATELEAALRDAAIVFDVSHPTLAAVVGEVSMLLSKIGI